MGHLNYKIYDSAPSTSNYLYLMLIGGLLTNSISPNLDVVEEKIIDKNVYIKNQSSFIPELNKFRIEVEKNDLLNLVNNGLSQIQNTKFDFLNVNEELNNEINKYIASYSGKNKEILEF